MKVIEKILDIEPAYHYDNIDKNQIVFFDIETTGLSADSSVLYLIGAVYYKKNKWCFVQWFADDSEDEAKMFEAFFKVLSNKKYLISFNGNGFDIPYLKKKIKQLRLNYSFDNIESIDLYKTCRKYKDMLGLDNCKLKTLEMYLGIYREDKYSGKELIKIYKEYIKIYSLERITNNIDKSSAMLEELLLHNEEDIINLLEVTKICYFDNVFNGDMTFDSYVCEEENIIIQYCTDYSIPMSNKESIIIENDSKNVITQIKKNTVKVIVKIYDCEMKYFYKDYKNYYYLIKEDTAIHKSVAQYVDKEYRCQAKPTNCYIKKRGKFVEGREDMDMVLFKKEYKDKTVYVEVDEVKKKGIDSFGKMLVGM